jgi:hypothetical protein
VYGSHLLFIASLGEKPKLHMARSIRNRPALLLNHPKVTLRGAHRQGNVESSLALLARVHALGHELCKFAIEIGLELWVALVFLALDNNLFVFLAMLATGRIVSLVLLARLAQASIGQRHTSEFSVDESSASSSSSGPSSERESSSPSSTSTDFSRPAGCW